MAPPAASIGPLAFSMTKFENQVKSNTILLLLVSAMFASAGVPGGVRGGLPPTQPSQAIRDLRAVRKGDKVTLTWSHPRQIAGGARPLGATRICRSVSSSPAASPPANPIAGCTPVGQVDAGKSGTTAGTSSLSLHFTDTLDDQLQSADPPRFAIYSVELAGADGRTVASSNPASISLAPIAAVKGLHFQLDVRGVFLIWEQEAEMRPTSVEYDFRLYRQEKDAHMGKSAAKKVAIPFLRSVVHTREGERLSAVDTNIEWEKSYVYWVRPVTRVYSPDHKLVAEIEGEDSEPTEVFAHDVFPPATPVGFLAMASEIPDKKFVDMVWAPNAENDVAEYRIYRKEEGGELTRIGTTPATMLSYHDSNVVAGHKYFYAISAVDLRGNESRKTPETTEVTP